jgi:hypothetical protein
MEGESQPPSGDERLSDRASHLSPRGEGRRVADNEFLPDDLTDWAYVRETLRLLLERDGMPTQLDDLSVDEFTQARLRRSDFSCIIKIWRKPAGANFHPVIKSAISEALVGRDPEIYLDDELLTIYMNVADNGHGTHVETEFFGLRLALILDGLPRVVVGRYRNFAPEDTKN